MARKGKWLSGVTAHTSAGEAARLALESRLYLVWRYLPLAAERSDEDPEYVHQLRVATRRAMAALETFAAFLPRKRGKRLTRRLRKVRKAAGAARDSDVLLARLREQARSRPNPAWAAVLAHVETQRRDAQRPIERIYAKLQRERFGRKLERFLRNVRFRGRKNKPAEHRNGHDAKNGDAAGHEPTFGQFARDSLRQAVEETFLAAGGDLNEIEALHQLRIRGKHLRYAMELVAGVLDPAMRDELYPTVERMQEKLGEVNDHAVGILTIEKLKKSADADSSEALEALVRAEQTALAESREAFLAWWTPQRAGELRRRFDELLGAVRSDEVEHAEDAAPAGQALPQLDQQATGAGSSPADLPPAAGAARPPVTADQPGD